MILNQLGIFGWKEADENLVLASLLTGDPLLLIGNHGLSAFRQDTCGHQGRAGTAPGGAEDVGPLGRSSGV